MFADHFAGGAELFVALVAIRTVAAGSEVMEADAVARFELAHSWAAFLDSAGNLMPEG